MLGLTEPARVAHYVRRARRCLLSTSSWYTRPRKGEQSKSTESFYMVDLLRM